MGLARNCSKRGRAQAAFFTLLPLIFAALLSAFSGEVCAAQSSPAKAGKPAKTKTPAKKAPPEASVPFHIGETLNYNVSWTAFSSAASVQFSIPERKELFGWGTWHFRVTAHTLNTIRTLFAVDDQFDSYTDAVTLECRQYEMYQNEMGKKHDEVLHLLPEGQSARGNLPGIIVSPGTRDPLGAIYSLRGVDWERTPELRAPVYDGHDVYELRAHREAPSDTVEVAAGKYSATKVSIHVFHRGKELAGETFAAWLAHDSARTPVLMEAYLPLGTLRMELVSASR